MQNDHMTHAHALQRLGEIEACILGLRHPFSFRAQALLAQRHALLVRLKTLENPPPAAPEQ
jgi:hypothetical protein